MAETLYLIKNVAKTLINLELGKESGGDIFHIPFRGEVKMTKVQVDDRRVQNLVKKGIFRVRQLR